MLTIAGVVRRAIVLKSGPGSESGSPDRASAVGVGSRAPGR